MDTFEKDKLSPARSCSLISGTSIKKGKFSFIDSLEPVRGQIMQFLLDKTKTRNLKMTLSSDPDQVKNRMSALEKPRFHPTVPEMFRPRKCFSRN